MQSHRLLVFLIAGWSGFFIMAVEMLSGRILAPYFGNSIHVWGAVISVFMLALALGYLMGGRLSLYQPQLRNFGLLLIAAALSLLPITIVGNTVLDWLFQQIADPRYGSLLAATLLFFIPTTLSGMVSPYAVRLLVHESALSGHYAGQLYFTSTFGSAAGTLLTSFYLVLYLEINQIILGLVSISMLIGVFSLVKKTNDPAQYH